MKKLLYTAVGLALMAGVAGMRAQFGDASQKLRVAEAVINQFYVDTVNEDRLVENAIKGMLDKLDPHSSYSNAEETRELNEPLEGNFSGIGITFNMSSDTLYVIQTVSGGPSERVGILAGDRIIAVNDTSIAGQKMKNSRIMKMLRGPKGTTVDVKVLRRGRGNTPDTIPFTITRDQIPIYSVDAAYMVDPKTGYLRLNKFAADTRDEVTKAVNDLKRQGMRQLILDLVDNGGGYLNAAVDLLSELLAPNSLAVYTEGRASSRYDHYTVPMGKTPLFDKGRLVVMVNQYSASASEITAGAVQDQDRGLIVGRRSFGKGLVQRPFPFPDGSMMRLTVAHYYTPSGRDIQKPYAAGDQKKYNHDILDRLQSGELMHADSIKYIDSLKVNTLRLKRPIYGGGGISPDVFVPLDTTDFTNYYRDVMAKGDINKFAIRYVDNNRAALKKKYSDDTAFVKNFTVSTEMLRELYDMAEKDGVKFNEEEARKSEPLFKTVIKGLIGRDTYDNPTYFKVFNEYDPIFKEAYRLINSPDYDRLLSTPSRSASR